MTTTRELHKAHRGGHSKQAAPLIIMHWHYLGPETFHRGGLCTQVVGKAGFTIVTLM